MKCPLVISVLVFFCSVSQAQQYSWNYMGIGFSDDGLGKGLTFSVASDLSPHLFARANILRTKSQTSTQPISHLFSFYTAGFQYGLFYVEGGVSQYDICWYACAGYSGYIAKLGLAGGSGKLTAKVGAEFLELMEQRWMIVEADASYALNENLGISLGVMDLDELGGKVTKMGLRLSW